MFICKYVDYFCALIVINLHYYHHQNHFNFQLLKQSPYRLLPFVLIYSRFGFWSTALCINSFFSDAASENDIQMVDCIHVLRQTDLPVKMNQFVVQIEMAIWL